VDVPQRKPSGNFMVIFAYFLEQRYKVQGSF